MKICLCCSTPFAAATWKCPLCGNTPEVKAGFLSFAPELSSDDGFKDSYFHELVTLEARNFWFRARNKLISWALRRYFSDAKNFLEIGCGTGFVLSGLAATNPGLKLAGSEISSAGLAYASQRIPDADFFQMDARSIPFVNEFDVVGAFDVLEHIEADEAVLNQMWQAVRPGGGIILTVPQHDFLWSQTDESACHVRRYDAQSLVNKIVDSGFIVERKTSFVSFLLPLMMAARMRHMKVDDKYDVLAELRIGGITNVVLEKIMDVERLAICSGLSFPVGGSLLLAARKI